MVLVATMVMVVATMVMVMVVALFCPVTPHHYQYHPSPSTQASNSSRRARITDREQTSSEVEDEVGDVGDVDGDGFILVDTKCDIFMCLCIVFIDLKEWELECKRTSPRCTQAKKGMCQRSAYAKIAHGRPYHPFMTLSRR